MSATVSITEDGVMTALRSFILAVVPGTVEVRQGQANRVAGPKGDYIIMTPKSRIRLATNVEAWDEAAEAPTEISNTHSTQFNVQLDLHGPGASDYAQAIATLARSDWGCINMLGGVVQPLYATDGSQMPFLTGENQYESRWVMEIALQANPSVSTPQDFAATLAATLIPSGG